MFLTGNTSTTSGLTVTLSRDQSSDCAIEAGALVLADQVWFLTKSLSIVITVRYPVPYGLTVHIVSFFVSHKHVSQGSKLIRVQIVLIRKKTLVGCVMVFYFTNQVPEPLFVP